MRALRTLIVVLFVALGFLGGYFVGWWLHGENVTRLTTSQRTTAKQAGDLQQRIIEELEGRYYKPVDPAKLSQAGVTGTLASLKDPYTVYLSPAETRDLEETNSGRYSGIGASLQKGKQGLVIVGVFAGSPAKAAGLKPGDVIVKIGGKPVTGLATESAIALIKGAEGTKVELDVQPKGQKTLKHFSITRRTIEIPETQDRILKAGKTKVGYVELYEFGGYASRDVARDVRALAAKGADWYIFDLRFNGGGLLTQAVDVTNVFQRGVVTSTKGFHSPLEVFRATNPVVTTKPMIVLVNGYSASASEIVTGALKDHDRAVIMGTRTFGKGLVQTIVPLGNESALKLTTAVYLTPDGTDINHKGITPTIVVPDKPKTKKDEQLQRALAYIAAHS